MNADLIPHVSATTFAKLPCVESLSSTMLNKGSRTCSLAGTTVGMAL